MTLYSVVLFSVSVLCDARSPMPVAHSPWPSMSMALPPRRDELRGRCWIICARHGAICVPSSFRCTFILVVLKISATLRCSNDSRSWPAQYDRPPQLSSFLVHAEGTELVKDEFRHAPTKHAFCLTMNYCLFASTYENIISMRICNYKLLSEK